jgi:hypothetical protein
MSQLTLFQNTPISPRVQSLRFSQMVEGMMFKFPKGQRYYMFDGKISKKFWYVDGKEQEYCTTSDSLVIIVSP